VHDLNGTTEAFIRDGQNAFVPTAEVTKSGNVTTVRITDVNGTTEASIETPTAHVTKENGVSTLTITDENGQTVVEVLDGQKGDKGDTPIRGTDYWTPLDQQIVTEQVEEIATTTARAIAINTATSVAGQQATSTAQAVARSILNDPDYKASIKGDKGDKGETGDTGDIGPQGPRGEKGDAYVLTEQDKSDIASLVSSLGIHICMAQEYDAQTGMPTVQNPDEHTFYLVPGGEENNLYIEWVYLDNKWEQFGSATVKIDVATVEETMAIITEYDEQEDEEGMVFDAYYTKNAWNDIYYETEADAQEIASAYKAGKNVIIRFNPNMDAENPQDGSGYWGFKSDIYITMIGYKEAFAGDESSEAQDEEFIFLASGNHIQPSKQGWSPAIQNINPVSVENGKLRFRMYVD
jgi:hypothetical protein